jgi:hypothetical protein
MKNSNYHRFLVGMGTCTKVRLTKGKNLTSIFLIYMEAIEGNNSYQRGGFEFQFIQHFQQENYSFRQGTRERERTLSLYG